MLGTLDPATPLLAEGCDCTNEVVGVRMVKGWALIETVRLDDSYVVDDATEEK